MIKFCFFTLLSFLYTPSVMGSFRFFQKEGSGYRLIESEKPRDQSDIQRMRSEIDEIKRQALQLSRADKERLNQQVVTFEAKLLWYQNAKDALQNTLNPVDSQVPEATNALDPHIEPVFIASGSSFAFKNPNNFFDDIESKVVSLNNDFKAVAVIKDAFRELKTNVPSYTQQHDYLVKLDTVIEKRVKKAVVTQKEVRERLEQIDEFLQKTPEARLSGLSSDALKIDQQEHILNYIPQDFVGRDVRLEKLLDSAFEKKTAKKEDLSWASRLAEFISSDYKKGVGTAHIQFSRIFYICEIIRATGESHLYDIFWNRIREKFIDGTLSVKERVLLLQHLPFTPDIAQTPIEINPQAAVSGVVSEKLIQLSDYAIEAVAKGKDFLKEREKALQLLQSDIKDFDPYKKLVVQPVNDIISDQLQKITENINHTPSSTTYVNVLGHRLGLERLIDQDKLSALHATYQEILKNHFDQKIGSVTTEGKVQLRQMLECITFYNLGTINTIGINGFRMQKRIERLISAGDSERIKDSDAGQALNNELTNAIKNPQKAQLFLEKLVLLYKDGISKLDIQLAHTRRYFITEYTNKIGRWMQEKIAFLEIKKDDAQRLQRFDEPVRKIGELLRDWVSGAERQPKWLRNLFQVCPIAEVLIKKLKFFARIPKPIFDVIVQQARFFASVGKKLQRFADAFAEYEADPRLIKLRRQEFERLKFIIEDIKKNSNSFIFSASKEFDGAFEGSARYAVKLFSILKSGAKSIITKDLGDRVLSARKNYDTASEKLRLALLELSENVSHEITLQVVRDAYKNAAIDERKSRILTAAVMDFLKTSDDLRLLYQELSDAFDDYSTLMLYFVDSFDAVAVNIDKKQNAGLVTQLLSLHQAISERSAFLDQVQSELEGLSAELRRVGVEIGVEMIAEDAIEDLTTLITDASIQHAHATLIAIEHLNSEINKKTNDITDQKDKAGAVGL